MILFEDILAGGGQTQDMDITEQLESGIRYLICYYKQIIS